MSLYLSGKLHHLLITGRLQSIYYRQSQFSFNHIITSRFTYLLGIIIIKDIITDLEDDAQVLSETLCLFNLQFRSIGRHRSDTGASLKESSRFLLNHLIINIFRYLFITDTVELKNLTIRQDTSQLSKITYDFF